MRRQSRHLALLLLLVTLAAPTWAGEKKTTATSEMHFLIVRQENGKPIRNASVVLHEIGEDGRQRQGLQLKTDSDGKAAIDGVPFGTIRVQVIAHGLQTFGEDYDVHQPAVDLKIELKEPQQQLSIYK